MLNTLPAAPISLKELISNTLDVNMLNFWRKKLNPLWVIDQPMAKIIQRQVAAQGSVTLILKPNQAVSLPRAGQHMMVGAEINGVRVSRSYSTSSVPDQPHWLSITVKQVKGGRFSQWLCQKAQVGDVLYLGQAFGDFQWPDQQQPILLLAAGSGITPMISLLRYYAQQALFAKQLPSKQSVQLHYWVSQRDEACFINELLALQKLQPNFSFHLYLTRQTALQPYEQQGRIQASQFAQQEDLTNSHVLACGSAGFVATARQLLQAKVASWQSEAFSPPQSQFQSHRTVGTDTVEITLQQQGRILTIPVGQSILSALETEGIAHPTGCRMGLCNTCACPKLSGSTQHLISGEQQHDADSALRICVSTARSDLVLDI